MEENIYYNCFACGKDNPIGLHLEFEYTDNYAIAQFACPNRYQGYEQTIHGGIIATMLDEAMAKIIIHQGLKAVTAQMTTHYHLPLSVGMRVLIKGWIVQQKSRTIHTEAKILDDQGRIIATAEAVYVVIK